MRDHWRQKVVHNLSTLSFLGVTVSSRNVHAKAIEATFRFCAAIVWFLLYFVREEEELFVWPPI